MNRDNWLQKCLHWKNKWIVFSEQQNLLNDERGLNLYAFIQVLNQNLKEDSIVVSDAGSSFYVVGQSLMLKPPQKWICSCSQAELGSGIGIATGVSLAKNKGEVILIIGDGSLQTNVSQLAVIKKHNLPIKIFIWNNEGYMTNRNTMNKFYEGRLIGTGPENGLWFPKIIRIAEAYGIDYHSIRKIDNLDYMVKFCLSSDEPTICEVICQKNQEVIPSAHAERGSDGDMISYPLSNMYPILSKDEYNKEMIKNEQ